MHLAALIRLQTAQRLSLLRCDWLCMQAYFKQSTSLLCGCRGNVNKPEHGTGRLVLSISGQLEIWLQNYAARTCVLDLEFQFHRIAQPTTGSSPALMLLPCVHSCTRRCASRRAARTWAAPGQAAAAALPAPSTILLHARRSSPSSTRRACPTWCAQAPAHSQSTGSRLHVLMLQSTVQHCTLLCGQSIPARLASLKQCRLMVLGQSNASHHSGDRSALRTSRLVSLTYQRPATQKSWVAAMTCCAILLL